MVIIRGDVTIPTTPSQNLESIVTSTPPGLAPVHTCRPKYRCVLPGYSIFKIINLWKRSKVLL